MFSTTTKEAANLTKDSAGNDIKNAAVSAKHDMHNKAGDVMEDLSDYANQAGRKVRGFMDKAGGEICTAGEKMTGEIRSNPVRSSAIALGLGFVLGAILRR